MYCTNIERTNYLFMMAILFNLFHLSVRRKSRDTFAFDWEISKIRGRLSNGMPDNVIRNKLFLLFWRSLTFVKIALLHEMPKVFYDPQFEYRIDFFNEEKVFTLFL